MVLRIKKYLIPVFICLCLSLCLTYISFAADVEKEKVRVAVNGQAALDDEIALVREKALKDAFRNAMEKALGVQIVAATVMENLTISKDVVISQSWGHLLSYNILKEWQTDDTYYITITAEVSADAKWWAEFENSLDVTRLHVKDLVLRKNYDLSGTIQPGAIYSNKVLVIPMRDRKYYINAIHTESLQKVWSVNLPDRLTAPLVSNDKWIIAVSKRDIICIDQRYGWINWKYSLDEPVYQPPEIYGDSLFLTTHKGSLQVLSLSKGQREWQYLSQSYFLTAPAVAGDHLYFVDSHGYLYSFNLQRQSKVYKHLIDSNIKAAPTPTQLFTFLNWTDGTDRVTAVNSNNGTRVWNFSGKGGRSTTSSLSPVLIHGKVLSVFVQGSKSRIYLLDAKTGYKYWEQELDVSITQIAGAGEGLVFLNTWHGIRILDLEYGNTLWESGAKSLSNQLLIGEEELYHLYDQTFDIYR